MRRGTRRSRRRRSRGARPAGRTCSRSPCGTSCGTPGRASARRGPASPGGAGPSRRSRTPRRSPGRCRRRTPRTAPAGAASGSRAPSLLTTFAIGRIRWITNGIALMSAADSRLVRSAGLPNQPIEPSAWTPMRVRVAHVRAGLQRAAAASQDRAEAAHLLALRVRRGQRARAAQVAVELVEQQLLGGHADEAGVQRLVQHPLHRAPARCADGLTSLRVARSRPISRGAHVGVADERREVRAERQRLERVDVLARRCSTSCARRRPG